MKKLITLSSLAQIVNIDDYGDANTGNGTQNDYTAIINALNSGATEVRGTAGKTYTYSQQVNIPSDVIFNGQGAVLKPHSSYTATRESVFIRCQASATVYSDEPIIVTEGSFTFTTSNPSRYSGANIGRVIEIRGGAVDFYNTSGFTYHWYSRIISVTGNTVTLQHAAMCSFTSTSVRRYTERKNVELKNWTFDFTGQITGFGLGFLDVYNLRINNCVLNATPHPSNSLQQGFFVRGIDVRINNCEANGGKQTAALGTLNTAAGSVAYGFNVAGQDVVVEYCTGTDWRHIFAGSGWSYLIVQYCTFNRGGGNDGMLDYHGLTSGIMRGNTLNDNGNGRDIVLLRGNNIIFEDNIINWDNTTSNSNQTYGVLMAENAHKGIVIRNNRFNWTVVPGKTNYVINAIRVRNNSAQIPIRDLQITGNKLTHTIYFEGKVGDNLNISDNYWDAYSSGYYPNIQFISSYVGSYTINNNQFNNPRSNASNWSINTGSTVVTNASSITNNKFYKTDCANNQTQIQGTLTNVTQSNNTTYTCATTPPAFPTIPVVPTPLPETPDAPVIGTITHNSVSMTFQPSAHSDVYNVHRSATLEGVFLEVAAGLSAGTFVDNTVSASSNYYYKVKGLNATGESSLSTATTLVTTPAASGSAPSTPSTPSVVATGSNFVTINIPSVATATHYKVYRATGLVSNTYVSVSENAISGNFTNSGLVQNTSYFYKVIASNANGDSALSAASAVATTSSNLIVKTKNPFKRKPLP